MSRREKTLALVLRGTSDANVGFESMRVLLKSLGFSERVRGSHHIFARIGATEILNLQPLGANCKAYQVKQVRGIILKYKLGGASND